MGLYERDPTDLSGVPSKISESGLGDVEGQIRYLIRPEGDGKSAIFTYFECVLPLQEDKVLIGTQDWEFKIGMGSYKTYDFGTMTIRASVGYEFESEEAELDELAIEYLRKVSDSYRVYLALEGNMDEVELIPELQWTIKENMTLKAGAGIGLTDETTDFAPEIGLMFRFD